MDQYSEAFLGELPLRSARPFIIAEAGVNHENDLTTALKMVEEAALAGADAIKFQSYKADRLASRHSPAYWDLSKEPTKSQHELFRKYDHFGDAQFISLAQAARECGIFFLSTPFDEHYADLLEPLMPAYKIASADITHFPLIRHCARKGKPMIISVGAATLTEIHEAVEVIRAAGNTQIALLHCVLSYPCSPDDVNLSTIPYLAGVFPECVVGYSDHVPPSCGTGILTTAWLLGARIIEKHFTLDKTKLGNDHYHAMDPDDLRELRQQLEYAGSLCGHRNKTVLPCELEARKQARRSLVATRQIAAGEEIAAGDIAIKRPGTGIEPRFLEQVIGACATCQIQDDQVIDWHMVNPL